MLLMAVKTSSKKTYSLHFKMSVTLTKIICLKMNVVLTFQCTINYFFPIVPLIVTIHTTFKVSFCTLIYIDGKHTNNWRDNFSKSIISLDNIIPFFNLCANG